MLPLLRRPTRAGRRAGAVMGGGADVVGCLRINDNAAGSFGSLWWANIHILYNKRPGGSTL